MSRKPIRELAALDTVKLDAEDGVPIFLGIRSPNRVQRVAVYYPEGDAIAPFADALRAIADYLEGK